jgi:hypothetical protein
VNIFNLSSGYSGTAFAAALLARSPYYLAEHEGRPTLFGPWTALWNESSGPPTDELADAVCRKLHAADVRRRESGRAHYADTSHGFVKGWGPVAVAMDLIGPENTRLVATRRAPAKVVRSMVALRMIPGGASFPCDHYWLDPHARRNRVFLTARAAHDTLGALLPVCQDGFIATQLIQAAWYVLEIEARIAAFRAEHPQFEVFTLDLETLDAIQLAAFFAHCGVPEPAGPAIAPVNAKDHLYEVPLGWADLALEALRQQLGCPPA